MFGYLKRMFSTAEFDGLYEGKWADEYANELLRACISENYNYLYKKSPTPMTHPELYDPLDPPEGYRYDPYYEIWIKL